MKVNKTMKASMSLAAAMGTLALAATSANAAVIGQLGKLESTANGGINPNTGNAWADGDTYRLFFVSSNTLADGNYSDNISAYDSLVQTAANTAGLGGVDWYTVAESVNNGNVGTNAFDKGSTDVGVFMVDSVKLADNIAGLGSVAANVTETGGTYNGAVSTGHNSSGYYSTSPFNANYRLGPSAPSSQTGIGYSDGTANWFVGGNYNGGGGTAFGNIDDGIQTHFYAISEDLTVSMTSVPEPTTTALLGLGGLALILRRRR